MVNPSVLFRLGGKEIMSWLIGIDFKPVCSICLRGGGGGETGHTMGYIGISGVMLIHDYRSRQTEGVLLCDLICASEHPFGVVNGLEKPFLPEH